MKPRPTTIPCRSCPAVVPVGARGPVPRLCPGCQQAAKLRALLSVAARREMEQAVRHVVKIETATEPAFQAEFIGAMAFPHATAPSPHLSTVVTLPERTASSGSERGGRRRRARGEKEES